MIGKFPNKAEVVMYRREKNEMAWLPTCSGLEWFKRMNDEREEVEEDSDE